MSSDRRGVLGSRDLRPHEVELINDIRTVEACFNALVDRLRSTLNIDQRQVSIAVTAGEDAFMRAVRAVEQPERLTIPTEALVRLEEA